MQDAKGIEARALLLVFFLFIVFFILFGEVAVLAGFGLVLFVFLFVEILGDEVQVDRMHLRNLQLGLALRATQDFAFFDFVFIDVDFGGTFRAADHGFFLRRDVHSAGVPSFATATVGVLYTASREVNPRAGRGSCEGIPRRAGIQRMASSREYPERPVVGVGGVIIDEGHALLIRRGSEPLRGRWSIPGGTLELGETLKEGTARELREETGLEVRVLELIEVFERIYPGNGPIPSDRKARPRFHYVIVDYLCERTGGEARVGSDVTDVAFAREEELAQYHLTETATRVLKKAFAMDRARRAAG